MDVSVLRRGVCLALLVVVAGGCNFITRASVDTSGGDPNARSHEPVLSGDGRYVVFWSEATDLVPGDGNTFYDLFRRDLRSGTTTRVTVDPSGDDAEGTGNLSTPAISADGRYVAFASNAGDLVPGDLNGFHDVFVRDMQLGITTRASVDTTGGDADNASGFGSGTSTVSLSADGRYVAFDSFAIDLVPEVDGNETADVFVRDLQEGTTTRASVDTAGGDPNRSSSQPSLSSDGRYLAFRSIASDLVPGDGNGQLDGFVRDLHAGTTVRATVDVDGGDSNGPTNNMDLSGNGRYLVFDSVATDLVPGGLFNVYVRDLQTATTTPVAVNTAGGAPNCTSFDPHISDDGRFVVFGSCANDLVPGDPDDGRRADMYVRDLATGTTSRATVNLFGVYSNNDSFDPAISGDGRYVAFVSEATNLVPGDHTGGTFGVDVFVRAVGTPPSVSSVAPSSVGRGDLVTLVVLGSGFSPDAQVLTTAFGPAGVDVTSIDRVSDSELRVTVMVGLDAQTGARNLMVWDPGTGPGSLAASFGFCFSCLTVT
jgi:Tol biopolymer transport system component